MADTKISGAPAVVTPAATDEYATAQAGASKKTTRLQMQTLAGATEQFTGDNASAPALVNETASQANPNVLPNKADVDSGMGHAGVLDSVNLIAGSKEGLRQTEVGGSILSRWQADFGLTAAAGGGQGTFILKSSFNIISTVATAGDSATLPAVFDIGTVVYVRNNGANAMDLFPASGDDLGQGVDTAVSIPAGETKSFIATANDTTWSPLTASGGGIGDVVKVGTPVNNQIGIWTGDGTIEGQAAFTWDNTDLFLTGNIKLGTTNDRPAILNETCSVLNPTILPYRADENTGLGGDGADSLAAIAGGRTGQRWDEQNAGVLTAYDTDEALTAFAGGGQGGATVLTKSYTVVTTVATAGDSVRLQTNHFKGTVCYIKNEGANSLDIFPAATDDLGAGVNVAVAIPAGEFKAFVSTADNATWTELLPVSAGVSFPLLGPDGLVTAPTYSFSGDPDTGMWKAGLGQIDFAINGVNAVKITADSIRAPNGSPTLCSFGFLSDITTGFYRPAAGQVDFSSSGTATWRFQAAAMGGITSGHPALRAEIASNTNPTLLPRNDDADTGVGRGGTNEIALVAGGLPVFRMQDTGSAGDDVTLNTTGGTNVTASTTQTQGQGLINGHVFTVVGTVANDDDVITLVGAAEGKWLHITNLGANRLQVFPEAGDQIGVNALNASITIESGGGILLFGHSASQWGIVAKAGDLGAVANDVVQARRTTNLTLTTAFVDVTLDTTDVETDSAVVEHDAVTDRIVAKVAGTYKIGYEVDIEVSTTGESTITADGRVRLNDTSVIAGSEALCGVLSDGSIIADFLQNHLSQEFYVTLAANDFITLQLEKVELGGTDTYDATRVLLTVERVK